MSPSIISLCPSVLSHGEGQGSWPSFLSATDALPSCPLSSQPVAFRIRLLVFVSSSSGFRRRLANRRLLVVAPRRSPCFLRASMSLFPTLLRREIRRPCVAQSPCTRRLALLNPTARSLPP